MEDLKAFASEMGNSARSGVLFWADGYARREGIAEDDFLKLAEIFKELELTPLETVLANFFRWKADGVDFEYAARLGMEDEKKGGSDDFE